MGGGNYHASGINQFRQGLVSAQEIRPLATTEWPECNIHEGEMLTSLRRVSFIVGALAVITLARSTAHAAFILTFTQNGSDVDATGSGTINTSAFSPPYDDGELGSVYPAAAGAILGAPDLVDELTYYGVSGPSSFGDGGYKNASSGGGDVVGIITGVGLVVPEGYVSGAFLSGTSTYDNETIAGLGLTPGDYVYTWGSGPTADSLRVDIPSVPEPTSLATLGISASALLLRRRRRMV